MKPPNIGTTPSTDQPVSEDLSTKNANNESINLQQNITPQPSIIASQVQQAPLALTIQSQTQDQLSTSSTPSTTTSTTSATTATTTTTKPLIAATTITTTPISVQPTVTSVTSVSASPNPLAKVATTVVATTLTTNTATLAATTIIPKSSTPTPPVAQTSTRVSTPIQLQTAFKSQLHSITPVPVNAHQQQLTVLINRPNLPIVPITATVPSGVGLTTNATTLSTLPLNAQPMTANSIPATSTTVLSTTPITLTTIPITVATTTVPISSQSNNLSTIQPTLPTNTQITSTLPTIPVPQTLGTSQNLPTTPNIKSETGKYICCLLDNGIRCERVACNASFSARIQKIVGTKKMNFALDPTVRHAYICEYHKNIICVAKKSATLARETKANARNYTANNNALAAATVVANNYNDISMRQQQQQQQTLQHPVNLEVIKNQGRLMNNHNAGPLNSIPMRQGQSPQLPYGHYTGAMPNHGGSNMDVMMSTSFDNTGGDTGLGIGIPSSTSGGTASGSGFDVDLQQLQVNTLRRYKRHFRVQTRPGLNKLQLAESLKLHFKTLPIIEKEAITYFVYIVKCYRNKLDHNPKAD